MYVCMYVCIYVCMCLCVCVCVCVYVYMQDPKVNGVTRPEAGVGKRGVEVRSQTSPSCLQKSVPKTFRSDLTRSFTLLKERVRSGLKNLLWTVRLAKMPKYIQRCRPTHLLMSTPVVATVYAI